MAARWNAGNPAERPLVGAMTLAPGDYVVRGIIRLEYRTTGRVPRTLRKVAK